MSVTSRGAAWYLKNGFSALTRESMFAYFCLCLPVGEQMAGYPIRRAGDRGDNAGRDYNFIWYRPADAHALDALLTDERPAARDEYTSAAGQY